MIGAPEIARLRRSAVLVNLGRGALVDEGALTQALERGEIASAALDVFEREPLPESSPLWSMPQVIVTPHVSGFGPRYWSRGIDLFGENLKRWIQGEPLQNVVDKSARLLVFCNRNHVHVSPDLVGHGGVAPPSKYLQDTTSSSRLALAHDLSTASHDT